LSYIDPTKIYNLYALRRSGSHAISIWILHQRYGMKSVNQNQINDKLHYFECGDQLAILFNNRGHGSLLNLYDESFANLEKNKDMESIHTAIISHEDLPISDSATQKAYGVELCFDDYTLKDDLFVLRDFKNWLASRYMHSKKYNSGRDFYEKCRQSCEMWLDYAKECLESNKYFILYDKWFRDVIYRRKLCDDLELEFIDVGMDKVFDYGKGSSFDGTRFDEHAQKMNVVGRYEQVKNEETIQSLVDEYKECMDMSTEIFQEINDYEA